MSDNGSSLPPGPETGRTVELSGVAQNAKGGAVLLTDRGEAVYIERLESWPDAVFRKRVKAKGRLVEKKFIQDPVVAGDGAVSQGAYGSQTVLEDAAWELMKE